MEVMIFSHFLIVSFVRMGVLTPETNKIFTSESDSIYIIEGLKPPTGNELLVGRLIKEQNYLDNVSKTRPHSFLKLDLHQI